MLVDGTSIEQIAPEQITAELSKSLQWIGKTERGPTGIEDHRYNLPDAQANHKPKQNPAKRSERIEQTRSAHFDMRRQLIAPGKLVRQNPLIP